MAEQTEAEVVAELAQAAVDPFVLERGKRYLIPDGTGGFVTDEDGDPRVLDTRNDMPERRVGTVKVADVPSFAWYFAKHSDPSSELYASIERATVTAVLDAHHGTTEAAPARWEQHRLVLALEETTAWKTWSQSDKKLKTQEQFAEFLEDNLRDIAPAAEQPHDSDGHPVIDAAGLLELVKNFHASVKAEFKGGVRLDNGQTQLTYVEEVSGGSSTTRQIEVPTVFNLAIAPFEDNATKLIAARFRYRLSEGKVHFAYVLDNPARHREDAVSEVVERLHHAIGTDRFIMTGQPI